MIDKVREIVEIIDEKMADPLHPFTIEKSQFNFQEDALEVAVFTATDGKGKMVQAIVMDDGEVKISEIPF